MPRKKRQEGAVRKEAWKDKLHTIHFSVDDEFEVRRWIEVANPAGGDLLEELLDNGWSVRISPPKSGDEFWCTVTAKNVEESLNGHSFSVHYPDLWTAVKLASFVVGQMIERGELNEIIRPKARAWLTESS